MKDLARTKPVAIVLGGITAHIPLIQKLKARGYFTILVDYYDNPPAKKHADQHQVVSTLDESKLMALTKNVHAELIITCCLDQPIPVACRVAKKLNLPFPYSETTALQVTDKSVMKKVFLKNGILTPGFSIIEHSDSVTVQNNLLRFKLPCIVKPVDSTGSQGVYKITSRTQIEHYFGLSRAVSRKKMILVEDYVDGIELGIDCFISNYKPSVLMIRRKFKTSTLHQQLTVGSVYPFELSSENEHIVYHTIDRVAKVFDLKNTPLLVQGILANGSFHVLEVAARVGGGMNYENVKTSCGFDLIEATINSYLGVTNDTSLNVQSKVRAVVHLYLNGGVFDRMVGIESMMDDGTIDSIMVLKEKGTLFREEMSSKSKIAKLLLSADSKTLMVEKIASLANRIDVLSSTNRSMLRKELLLNLTNNNTK